MAEVQNIGLSFRGESIGDVFKKIRPRMLEADIIPSRICDTKELLNPVIMITDPSKRLLYSEHRLFNLIYAITDAYMLFNPTNSVKPFALFNKKMLEYSDNGATINSAYGQYISTSLSKVAAKLKYDNDTRQAVVSIYNNSFVDRVTKDVPCTLSLHFMIRDGLLNLTTYMRSNDLFWGFQYDVFVFTALQEIMAREIGVGMGTYIHCPTSLHVYKYHWDMMQQLRPKDIIDIQPMSFNTDINGAASAAMIIERFADFSGEEAMQQYSSAFAGLVRNNKTADLLPIHLVLLELLFRNARGTFDEVTKNMNLKSAWFAPFTKRWTK